MKEVAPVPPRATASVPVVSESAMPSEEVAKAVTLPVTPVLLPRIVLALTCASFVRAVPLVASERVPEVPPTKAPSVPEYESSEARDGVEVAAPYAPPLALVATRPEVSEENVGAFVKVCVEPHVLAVVVPNASEIVLAEFWSGYVNVSAACFALKVVQSVPERRPRILAVAVGTLKVKVVPELVMPQSFDIAVEEVARVRAPVCAEPLEWVSESTPVLVRVPAAPPRSAPQVPE